MKQFIEPELKVTRFEYENLMDNTGIVDGSSPETEEEIDMMSLWGE